MKTRDEYFAEFRAIENAKAAERRRKWNAANRDKIAKQNKEYYQKNRSAVLAKRSDRSRRVTASPYLQYYIKTNEGLAFYLMAKSKDRAKQSAIRMGYISHASEVTDCGLYLPSE